MELAGTCLFEKEFLVSCLEQWSQNKTWCFPKQETGHPSPFLPRLDHVRYLVDGMDFPPLEKVQCFSSFGGASFSSSHLILLMDTKQSFWDY